MPPFSPLDQAFELAGLEKNPLSDNNLVRLRTLVYMVRCAYAHGIADPKWKVRGNYRQSMSVDLPNGPINSISGNSMVRVSVLNIWVVIAAGF